MLYNGARFDSCASFCPSGRNSEFNKEPEIERKSSKFNVLRDSFFFLKEKLNHKNKQTCFLIKLKILRIIFYYYFKYLSLFVIIRSLDVS